jgi:predicted short-subunit dehydrogenase-like oxidoreductase (DUF2520 family)
VKRGSAHPLRGETIALFGAGGLARALAPALLAAGARLAVHARRPAAARALVHGLGRRAALAPDARAALERATLLILCVPDDVLAPLARELAPLAAGRGRAALHASGFQGERALAALARAGWQTGWMHPLAPLPRTGRAARGFAGAWFATGGTPRARALVRALGGRELALRPGRAADYHLAATLVSNGSLALFELARGRFERAARDPRAARAAFAALLAATAANLARSSPREALTGPVARGDLASLRGHLARLRLPAERELYRALGRVLLRLAAPRLPRARRAALAQLLAHPRRR